MSLSIYPSFTHFSPAIKLALDEWFQEKKYKSLTKTQDDVFKQLNLQNAGSSWNIVAKTGSGKTWAYLLAVMASLKSDEEQGIRSKAVVIAPTKELVMQLSEDAKDIAHSLKLKVRRIKKWGGRPANEVEGADLLILTPGQWESLVTVMPQVVPSFKYVVCDEADQILHHTFKSFLRSLNSLPKESHVIAVSATWTNDSELALETLKVGRSWQQLFIDLPQSVGHRIDTFNLFVTIKERILALEQLCKKRAAGPGVIFFNSQRSLEIVAKELQERVKDRSFVIAHGKMTPDERRKVLRRFAELKRGVLLATDVLARGLNIESLKWVVNYDLPQDRLYYIHRSGRVGRVSDGEVFNLIIPERYEYVQEINSAIVEEKGLRLDVIKVPKHVLTKDKIVKEAKHQKDIERKKQAAIKKDPHPRIKMAVPKKAPRYVKAKAKKEKVIGEAITKRTKKKAIKRVVTKKSPVAVGNKTKEREKTVTPVAPVTTTRTRPTTKRVRPAPRAKKGHKAK
jgi:superfamily II DNA/RNA helicase